MSPLAEIASRTIPISIVTFPQAPRTNRRRVQNRNNPVRPPSHHSIELCNGELGGLFTTTCRCVVAGGYEVAAVLAMTVTCPGENTQIALAGNEEARH